MAWRYHLVFKYFGVTVVLSAVVLLYLITNYLQPFSSSHERVYTSVVPNIETYVYEEPSATTNPTEIFNTHAPQENDCYEACQDPIAQNSSLSSKILVIGASTFIGSSVSFYLQKKMFEVLPIETEEIHLLTASQYRNLEKLSSIKLETLVIESNEVKSALDELNTIQEIIYIPRTVHDCILDSSILKEEGVAALKFLTNLLEAIKDEGQNVRITMITRPKRRLTSVQSAWLQTLENSLKTYHSLYQIRVAFVMVDAAVASYERREIDVNHGQEQFREVFQKVECTLRDNRSKCLTLVVKLFNESGGPPVSPKERNTLQKNVVMSTYFTTIQNPQYAVTIAKNTFKFMQDWLISANKFGIQAIIFHDSLSPSFVSRIENNFDNVVFEKVKGFSGRTPNDYRFYLQLQYLKKHPEINNVILSDIRDVTFFNDPFEVMDVIGNYMYVGVDVSYYTDSWSHLYPRGIINTCYRREANTITVTSHPFYNAGVIASTRPMMLKYLKHVTESLDKTPRGRNCNMATITIVTHKYFRDLAFSGFPFQSAFKMDIPGPQGLAVKHKIEHKNL